MMLLPTKITRIGVSTGGVLTTGTWKAWLSAADEYRTSDSAVHRAAMEIVFKNFMQRAGGTETPRLRL